MIIRKLRPEEAWKSAIAGAVAFEFGIDIEKKKEEALTAKPNGDVTWAALADDDDTLYGCMGVRPYTVRFDGATFTVVDEGSSFGTWVDQTKLTPGTPVTVHRGQVLKIGSSKEVLQLHS